jgi:formimidoylglutamate deiminase
VITLDLARPWFASRAGDQLLDSWMFAAAGSSIDRIYRAGVELVVGGCHRDRTGIEARYRSALERVLRAV